MKNLVIVESPAKAKTINKILGKDYIVKASMGHVRDLPQKELGVDLENDFKPKYVNIDTRAKVIKELKEIASTADTIYLAPDPDREGEAIAWHLEAALRTKNDPRKYLRVTYNEITAPAIRKAFQEPRKIDQNKVDSQQARRILDRIVGYQVSPLLWRQIRGATSAGRVQSAALRLVCEREREIINFKPEEFWLLGAKVRKLVDPRDVFEIRLAKINGEKADIKAAEEAHKIRADLEGRTLKVSAIIRRELSRRAPPSFITSTLQQSASSRLGYPPKRTMQLAQKLYEGKDFGDGPVGLITYMRTDSVALAPEAVQAAREFIGKTFGREFIPDTPNFFKSKASAQEAHEAIRPTDVTRTPESVARYLDPDELKLYKLIWERFVACQMSPAQIAQRTAEIEAPPPAGKTSTYLFRATASEITFPGYMRVTGAEQRREEEAKNEDGEQETPLPPLDEGESLEKMEWLEERKETQPPPRFTEASLVKALEENGVGRPSTYAQTISTIVDRQYVLKDKRALKPTTMGLAVNDFLVKYLPSLFDIKFTANMELLLDEVEEGKVEWHQMLREFYTAFVVWVEGAKVPPADKKVVSALLNVLNDVKTWGPETKRGRKTYSDSKFVLSVRDQLEDKEAQPVSERQMDALLKVAARYRDQLPKLEAEAKRLGLGETLREHVVTQLPPSPEMTRKCELLEGITFGEPRTIGKRTYDDKKFYESLRDQVRAGRGLSTNQSAYLDKLLFKYADQVPNFEAIAKELGLDQQPVADGDPYAGPILELMGAVKEWKPPVTKGKMTWDDHGFFDSLNRQFRVKKVLTLKQSMALKKMLRRYADQVPGYDEKIETLNLLPRAKKKEKAGK